MGTTADKLNALKATKAAIKQAITNKGGAPGDVFSAYPALIDAIGGAIPPNPVEFYKCTSVDTVGKTWSGNKAILQDGVYTFSSDITSGLSYTSVAPSVGNIYSSDALITVSYLWTGDTLNTDKTRFLLMPSRSNNEIKDIAIGRDQHVTLQNVENVPVIDGAMVFTDDYYSSYLKIPGDTLSKDLYNGVDSFVVHIDIDLSELTMDRASFYGYSTGYRNELLFEKPSYLSGGSLAYNRISGYSQSRQLITVEYWTNSAGKHLASCYRNGVKVGEIENPIPKDRAYEIWIGKAYDDANNRFAGKIYMVALIAGQPYEGKDFTPPYIPPEA